VKDYPQSWNTYDSLGEAYDKKGDKKLAAENYRRAQNMTKDPEQRKRIAAILAKMGG
jgi:Tfp pilus assembly protein PilF